MATSSIFLTEGTLATSTIMAVDAVSNEGNDNNRKKIAQKLFCAYFGPSMHPTLATQDLLEIAPYTVARRPEPGDVILCTAPIANLYVIHRIIASTPTGFRTRGDNSNSDDPWLLTEREIIGRVVAAYRQTGRRPVHGGTAGRLLAAHCSLRRRSLSVLIVLLRPLSRVIRHGILKARLPLQGCRFQLYSFGNRDRTDYRLMAGRKIIGVFDHTTRRWRIRLPYRLFFDESSLPLPDKIAEQAR